MLVKKKEHDRALFFLRPHTSGTEVQILIHIPDSLRASDGLNHAWIDDIGTVLGRVSKKTSAAKHVF